MLVALGVPFSNDSLAEDGTTPESLFLSGHAQQHVKTAHCQRLLSDIYANAMPCFDASGWAR